MDIQPRHAGTVAELVGDPRPRGLESLEARMPSLVFLGIVVALASIGLAAGLGHDAAKAQSSAGPGRSSGTSPELTTNWFRSADTTVNVTRSGTGPSSLAA